MSYKAFMIMPFKPTQTRICYENSIKPICSDLGITICNASEIYSNNVIYDDIVSFIKDADLIIADTTDNNPNVFYELGIAHSIKNDKTILITSGDVDELPFDVKHFRVLRFVNDISLINRFNESLRQTIEIITVDVPQSKKIRFETIYEVLLATKNIYVLYFIVGIGNPLTSVITNSMVEIWGHFGDPRNRQGQISFDNGKMHSILFDMGLIDTENGCIKATSDGEYFVKYLLNKGYCCDYLNGVVLTDGFIRPEQIIQNLPTHVG